MIPVIVDKEEVAVPLIDGSAVLLQDLERHPRLGDGGVVDALDVMIVEHDDAVVAGSLE
jgi:hypothetical protein